MPQLVIKTRTPNSANNDPSSDDPHLENVDLESPIGGSPDDWAAMRDELDEFMGSDNESDSDASVISNLSVRNRKRKREDESDGGEDEDEEGVGGDGSELSKKIKRVHERSTGLRAVQSIDSEHPSRTGTPGMDEDGDEDGDDGEEDDVEGEGDGEEEEDDLEAALERALQEEEEEEEEEAAG